MPSSISKFIMRPFVVFSIIMFIKSYITWAVIFKEGLLWGVLVSEMPLIWLLFCLVEMFSSKRKIPIYLTLNVGITAIFFATIMYYKYYGVIVTYHALNQLNQVTAVKDSVVTIIDPYFILIFIDLLVLSIWYYKSKNGRKWIKLAQKRRNKNVVISFMIVCMIVSFGNIIKNKAVINEFVRAEEMGILGYEAFTMIASEKPEEIDEDEFTQEVIDKLKGIDVVANVTPEYWGLAEGKNIILIQMESFQNFLIGLTVNGQEVTPVMNRLAREHFYFPNFYQQVGPGTTSDAEFTVNTSLYIPPRGAATDMYAMKELPSMPKLLKEKGYMTETFHTNDVEFWNRDQLYPALGFDHYYERDYFDWDDFVFFGASDEVLYERVADRFGELVEEDQLFYAHVISMTAHHPYTLPEEKQFFELSEHEQNTLVGNYFVAQHYADYALGLFIDELVELGLWDNSLIVLYGDHLGLPAHLLDVDDAELLAEVLGHDYHDLDMLNVPLIIASKGITYPAVLEQLGGQVDILPTIANLVGISLEDQLHFGQDILNQTENVLPQRHYLPSGSLIKGETLFIPGKSYEDGSTFSIVHEENGDLIVSEDTIVEEDFENALKLVKLSDSYINQLPDRKVLQKDE